MGLSEYHQRPELAFGLPDDDIDPRLGVPFLDRRAVKEPVE